MSEKNGLLQTAEPSWDSAKFLSKYTPLMQEIANGNSYHYYKVKEMRAQEYLNTIAIANQHFYITEEGKKVELPSDSEMMKNTVFYDAPVLVENVAGCEKPTTIEVTNADCILEGLRLKAMGLNPAVLNMANRQMPGGGVLTGAGAQEETIFRRTNLFRSLYQFADSYYQIKYMGDYDSGDNTHTYPLDRNFGGVYTPDAVLFRMGESKGYKLMDVPETLSFISVAGINHPDLKDATHIADHHVEAVKNKLRTILRIGLANGHDSLVLGALGCGAFRNPPAHVATLFHEVIEEPEFRNKYKLIDFAIIDDHNAHHSHNPEGNFKPFYDEFCKEREAK